MDELASPLKIRAHHLLCLLGFRGLGYSQKFIVKMEEVAKKLHTNSTFPIILVAEYDIICALCPHNKESRCLKETGAESKVKIRDLEVLHRLGFEVGAQMPAGKAWARIKEQLTSKDLTEICRDCEWLELGYCIEGLIRKSRDSADCKLKNARCKSLMANRKVTIKNHKSNTG